MYGDREVHRGVGDRAAERAAVANNRRYALKLNDETTSSRDVVALQAKAERYDPGTLACAGVILTVGNDGALTRTAGLCAPRTPAKQPAGQGRATTQPTRPTTTTRAGGDAAIKADADSSAICLDQAASGAGEGRGEASTPAAPTAADRLLRALQLSFAPKSAHVPTLTDCAG
jgi:hypothetical protein